MMFNKSVNFIAIVCWYTFAICDLGLFFYGFFPETIKSTHIVVQPPSTINHARMDSYNFYRPAASRLIFIMIDALRRDFVTEKYMPYLYNNVKEHGCLFSLRAETPTVTMPRIKAITTGSVPQFIDIALNFASSEIITDSLLHRAKEADYKMVFYGDDTWLKLYPNMFHRSEGTTSFYVTDFTEVDNNVTRHLPRELKNKDWEILILHYLGLDHIGHIYGAFNPLIEKKLREMDNIIQQIHTSINDTQTIIMICGDHGMRDAGGHGGSTEAETLVPLAVLGIPCLSHDHDISAQIDIAPTIAALMGLPLPAENVGRILMELIHSYSIPRQLYFLHYNALNLIQKNQDKMLNQFRELFYKHEEFIKFGNQSENDLLIKYDQKIREVSENLIRSSSTQHMSFLYLSCSALFIILLAILAPKPIFTYLWSSLYFTSTLLIIFMLFSPENTFLSKIVDIYCIVPIFASLYILPTIFELVRKISGSSMLIFLSGGTIVRTISFASTSSIEEEHQTWYFLWGTLTVLGVYRELTSNRRSGFNMFLWIMLFAVLRLCRDWNHASTPLAGWLQKQDHSIWLFVVLAIGLVGVTVTTTQMFNNDKLINLFTIATVVIIFWYRLAVHYYNQTVLQARISMLLILINAIVCFIKHRCIFKTLTIMWILWTTLLMRPHNVILIPICIASSQILRRISTSVTCSALMHIWLASVLFHCQGFSNSLASIDISPGYVGLSGYSIILTSFQVICNVYTFQILSTLLLINNLKYHDQEKALHTLIIHQLFSIMYICIITLVHRSHLFIWSVFSPKLLIEACHSICLLLCLLLYQIIRIVCTEKQPMNKFNY